MKNILTVKKEKSEFYLRIRLSYGEEIVVPMDAGLSALTTLIAGEHYDTSDYNEHTIGPPKDHNFEPKILTADEYREMKMKHTILDKEAEKESS